MSESFDAPMTDSGDLDVSMYPTMASTDPWLSTEASMSEDGYLATSATFNYTQEDVEVEMGDDDEPITEYEMADEGGGYDDQELLDVEVYDVSQAPSPRVEESYENPGSSHLEPELIPFQSSDDLAQGLPDVPIVETSDTYGTSNPDHATELAEFSKTEDLPESEPTTAIVITEVSSLEDASAPSDIAAPQAAETSPVILEPQSASRRATLAQVPLPSPLAFKPVSSGSDGAESEVQGVADHAATEDHATELHDVVESTVDATVEPGDPHEISEGVYIDPPPAVLLSLPPCAEYSECSLFNLPISSVPHSPSSSAKPDNGDALHLLLHARPTLYYEPLSAVFSALRQEPCVQNMPGFHEAELVLDAYDLQLAISEDNVFTHEVTLHELNVIHDGSDLTGPLRLRLKVFAPRFVTRYTTLRDQIARLNLTGDEDALYAGGLPTEPQQTDDAPSGAQDDQDHTDSHELHRAEEQYHPGEYGTVQENHGEPEAADTEPGISIGDNPHNDSHEMQHHSEDVLEAQADAEAEEASAAYNETVAEGEDNTGDEEAVAVVDNNKQPSEEGAAVEGDHESEEGRPENITADAAEEYQESEETLDADEVHHPAVEEGGDYVDYDEFPDDENDFGDGLSEEFGDEESREGVNVAVVHNEATFVEEGEEYEPDEFGGVEELEHHEEADLNEHLATDSTPHSNSIEAPAREPEDDQTVPVTSPHHSVTNHADTSLNDDFEELAEWEDAEDYKPISADRSDTLSHKSSTATLASRTSKRAYDEYELDDFDDDDDLAPATPDTKRPRVE